MAYEIIPARVINQSIHSIRNKITLDKGKLDTIEAPMGVMTESGVVGVIIKVSDHFALANSMLNVDTRISVSLKGEGYFGSLSWTGRDYNEVIVTGVPKHAEINIGDTIVTNGYSTLFPAGIPAALVEEYELDRTGDFYAIRCRPVVNFGKLQHVYAIKNNLKEEISILENEQ